MMHHTVQQMYALYATAYMQVYQLFTGQCSACQTAVNRLVEVLTFIE